MGLACYFERRVSLGRQKSFARAVAQAQEYFTFKTKSYLRWRGAVRFLPLKWHPALEMTKSERFYFKFPTTILP